MREEEVLAVRQELRPACAGLSFVTALLEHDRLGDTACGLHAHQRIGGTCVEEDDAVLTPGSVGAIGQDVGDRLRRASRDVYFLQLAADRKRDEAAVRGPERSLNPLGAWQWPRLERVHRTDPDHPLAIAFGGKNDVAAVW